MRPRTANGMESIIFASEEVEFDGEGYHPWAGGSRCLYLIHRTQDAMGQTLYEEVQDSNWWLILRIW
jgi:hypothetical protein